MSSLNMLCACTNPVALDVHKMQRDISGWRAMKAEGILNVFCNSNGNYNSTSPHLSLN